MKKNKAARAQFTKSTSVPIVVIDKKKKHAFDLNQEARSVLTSLTKGNFFTGERHVVTYPPHEHQLLDFVEDHHARVFRQHRAAKKRMDTPCFTTKASVGDDSGRVDYRAIVEGMPFGVAVIIAHEIVFANKAFLHIMGVRHLPELSSGSFLRSIAHAASRIQHGVGVRTILLKQPDGTCLRVRAHICVDSKAAPGSIQITIENSRYP